jgi:hypothetical protein
LTGFISKPMKSTGRNTRDRQFVFINKRPVDYQRITKVINEVYRQANPSQYPIVFINLEMSTGTPPPNSYLLIFVFVFCIFFYFFMSLFSVLFIWLLLIRLLMHTSRLL